MSEQTDTITVRAPGRVNLIGEHTDYTGGLVFPIAIDRYTDIVASPSTRWHLRSDAEPDALDAPADAQIDDPALPGWGRFVIAVARQLGAASGLTGEVTTTLPVGAGLSSSAALELAVAVALGFDGTPQELAVLAQRAEQAATGVPTGIMDQLCIAAATAGHATMIDCATREVTQVPIPDDVGIVVRFIAHRTLEGSEYGDRVAQCAAAEAVIGPLRDASLSDVAKIDDPIAQARARHVITDNQRVLDFAAAIAAGDYRTAGELMVACHRSLADDFAISTPAMDAAVDELLATPGVYGARMTGGGFGGCVVALTEPDANVDGWHVTPVSGVHRIPGRS